jgi:sugar lactone lactonase YvrE
MKSHWNSSLSCGAAVLASFFITTLMYSAPGDLYVADSNSASIFRYTADGNRSTFASGLVQPVAGLAFDRDGNVFVADTGGASILKIDRAGNVTTFATTNFVMYDLAFDGSENLFVSKSSEIVKFSPDGIQSTFASGVEGVWPLAFDKAGNLYAGLCTIGPGEIVRFAPDGTRSTFVAFSGPGECTTALAFDTAGNLFAKRGLAILKIAPDGSSMTTFATGDFHSNCLAFDAEGNLFAGLNAFNSSEPAIVKFAPDGTQSTFAPGLLTPTALAFEPVTEKLRNISARGLVGTGNDVLIGGFIVGGNALANSAVLLRAIGPSLSGSGVSNPLADPTLELHNASGALITSNDDWQDTQEELITATGIPPADPKESAIYATLPAGNYTAVLRGVGDSTGTALIEVYSLSE